MLNGNSITDICCIIFLMYWFIYMLLEQIQNVIWFILLMFCFKKNLKISKE